MIIALIIDTDDTDMVDSLAMAAEWDEGITIKHGGGADVIETFTLLDNPTISEDGEAVFTVPVER